MSQTQTTGKLWWCPAFRILLDSSNCNDTLIYLAAAIDDAHFGPYTKGFAQMPISYTGAEGLKIIPQENTWEQKPRCWILLPLSFQNLFWAKEGIFFILLLALSSLASPLENTIESRHSRKFVVNAFPWGAWPIMMYHATRGLAIELKAGCLFGSNHLIDT